MLVHGGSMMAPIVTLSLLVWCVLLQSCTLCTVQCLPCRTGRGQHQPLSAYTGEGDCTAGRAVLRQEEEGVHTLQGLHTHMVGNALHLTPCTLPYPYIFYGTFIHIHITLCCSEKATIYCSYVDTNLETV